MADVIEQVRTSTDIVSVVGEYVQLKRVGDRYKGLCPFHGEKTPSFTVSREKGIFYCFGCHATGNIFQFLQRIEGIDFHEALERLSEKAGIEVGPSSEADMEAVRLRKTAYEAYKLADDFYRSGWRAQGAEPARKYLIDRGITWQDVDSFHIGYAPDAWSLLTEELLSKGFERSFLVQIGLSMKSQTTDNHFDGLRNRIIFPIFDERRRVVGFGGRSIDGSEPKYKNSSESIIFTKGKCLYGLVQARDTIRADEEAILVEGYMDVIACHRAGLINAVASLGTSLTRDQARILSRMCKSVVVCYDSDNAGVAAATKAYATLASEGIRVRIAHLSGGKDPDEILKVSGQEGLKSQLGAAKPMVEWRLDRIRNEYDLGSTEGKVQAVADLVPILSGLGNAIEVAEYSRLIARTLQVPLNAVEQEVERATRTPDAKQVHGDITTVRRDNKRVSTTSVEPLNISVPGLQPAVIRAESELISLMLDDPDIRGVIKRSMGTEVFKVPIHKEIVDVLFENGMDGIPIDMNGIMNKLDSDEAKRVTAGLAMRVRPGEDKERIFLDCANKLRESQLLDEMGQLKKRAELLYADGRMVEVEECLRHLKTLADRLDKEFRSPQV